MYIFVVVFLALLMWHALADFPLQGDFLSRAKNSLKPFEGVGWQYALLMHGLIHAIGVWIITQSLVLACVEIFLHCLIDDAKNRNFISFNEDQSWHVACKAVYAFCCTIPPVAHLAVVDWSLKPSVFW